jgi:hypothetical protein
MDFAPIARRLALQAACCTSSPRALGAPEHRVSPRTVPARPQKEIFNDPPPTLMTLDADDIEAIATRVAELLRDEAPASSPRLADAAQVARELGVDREWVYAHARDLGATRLGGDRGRWRFDLARIRRDLACPAASTSRPSGRRRPRRQQPKRRRGDVELIPYSEVRSSRQANSGRGRRANAPPT